MTRKELCEFLTQHYEDNSDVKNKTLEIFESLSENQNFFVLEKHISSYVYILYHMTSRFSLLPICLIYNQKLYKKRIYFKTEG